MEYIRDRKTAFATIWNMENYIYKFCPLKCFVQSGFIFLYFYISALQLWVEFENISRSYSGRHNFHNMCLWLLILVLGILKSFGDYFQDDFWILHKLFCEQWLNSVIIAMQEIYNFSDFAVVNRTVCNRKNSCNWIIFEIYPRKLCLTMRLMI